MATGRVRFQAGVNQTGGDEAEVISRLRQLAHFLRRNILVTSGFRTYAQQVGLQGHKGPVAAPGHSQHELGRAADAEIDGRPFWQVVSAKTAARFGLATYPGGTKQDPVHVELDSASNVSGAASGGSTVQKFNATAYGPPWGGIQGGGTTATGIDLSGAPHKYIVAVDPTVIPLHSKLKIWPNPFGNKPIIFAAEDTGGAIKGNRIDFYDWRGRKTQLAWGMKRVNVEVVSGAASSTFGRTRPGGDSGGDSSAALADAFSFDFTDNPTGDGPQVSDTGQGGMENVGFVIPGIPGFGHIGPIPVPIPKIPNPLDLFNHTKDAINGAEDFLKWVAWIFHPRNILRIVEFLTGLVIMGFGLHTWIEAHRSAPNASRGRARRTVMRGINLTPVGRSLRVAKGARLGKREARVTKQRQEWNEARKSGRKKEQERQRTTRVQRRQKKADRDAPPF